tara:strand:- start:81 stop:1202 length:1122 start_codon:yes stop_codon:yes gene_type:complete
MYYNLSEEQKIFLAHSYAMLKAGYTHDEIVEYWTCNDQEKVQNIVEDLEYIPVDLKDEDLLKFLDEGLGILNYVDDVLRIGSQGLKYGRSAIRQIPRAARATQGVINRTDDTVRGVVRALRGGTGTDRMNYLMKNVNKIDDVQRKELRTLMSRNQADALKFTPAQFDSVRGTGSHQRALQRYQAANKDGRLTQTPSGNYTVNPRGGGPGSGSQAARDQKLTDALRSNTSTSVQQAAPTVVNRTKGAENPSLVKLAGGGLVTGGAIVAGSAGTQVVKDMLKTPDKSGTDTPDTSSNSNTEPKIPKTPEEKTNRCASTFGKGYSWNSKSKMCTKEEAYEFILDKLISEGHASSLTEAEYVFKQLDDEYIESMLNE